MSGSRWTAVALACITSSAIAANDQTSDPRSSVGVEMFSNVVSARTSSSATPPPAFRSALEGYRPYRADEPLRDWREINDEVGRLGGHQGNLEHKTLSGGSGHDHAKRGHAK
ncbi:MAG: hypothetical protein ROZ37_09735 [Aromatoleum sp.]|uniref:hypothetical protein n=1 Tax=Aromatoleum sp. TaxID=2307007 RepID=UPI0028956C29|nr:hypothetical protein [Aromatoleum sp.]MDT3670600.1 hypothetical protein [Aromatoleum sp.]